MTARSASAGPERSLPGAALPAVRGARRLFALLVVTAVALASIFSGRTYLWCAPMQQVELVCLDDDDEPADGPTLREACCEAFAIGELPRAELRDALPPVLPAHVALVPDALPPPASPAFTAVHLASAAKTITGAAPTRAGPPSAAERCARLQVFHC